MRRLTMAVAAVAIVSLATTGLGAQTAPPPADGLAIAKAFGQREAIQQISLSPDGNKIAMLVPTTARGLSLVVLDLEKGPGATKAIASSSGDRDQLTRCHWSTDTRLICQLYLTTPIEGREVGYTRTLAINADGSGMKDLTAKTTGQALGFNQNGGELIDWGAGGFGGALMTRSYVPEFSTGSLTAKNKSGLGVDLVDTVTLNRKTVEPPRDGAVGYISDGQGVVRAMGIRNTTSIGYSGNRISYFYRLPDNREWKPLSTVTMEAGLSSGFSPVAIDRTLNVAYGYENQTGHTALYSVSLDGKLTKTLVASHPQVDIGGLISIGRQNRVVGVTYVTDRRSAIFFDQALKAFQLGLAKALPGRQIAFIDASADENKLILFAGSDTDPGQYYLFDKKTRSLAPIIPVRGALAEVKLATVKSVSYQAADGTSIPAYLTLPAGSDGKGLPAIVLPHGGPGARDEWGFDYLAQYFAARGYAVIQPNFRGSTGYGDAWYQKNGFQGWRTAIGDVNDAGRWLVKSGVADPSKLAIVGWSYGGYAALQSSVLDPGLFKAIVAIAPVTDLDTLREEARNTYSFPQVDAFIGHGAWVTEGSPARNAGAIKAPVLMFHGDRDVNVGIGESRLMLGKLLGAGRRAELVEYKGLDHQIDDSVVRAAMLARADAFLRASMGMKP